MLKFLREINVVYFKLVRYSQTVMFASVSSILRVSFLDTRSAPQFGWAHLWCFQGRVAGIQTSGLALS